MDVFGRLDAYDYGEVHFKLDKATGLKAIVAIHDNPLKTHMVYQNLHADHYLEGDIAASLSLLAAAVPASSDTARRQHWSREHDLYLATRRAEGSGDCRACGWATADGTVRRGWR